MLPEIMLHNILMKFYNKIFVVTEFVLHFKYSLESWEGEFSRGGVPSSEFSAMM